MKTPVVLFIFKRKHTLARIMERIAQAAPETFYIISDQGRNEEEKALVLECRALVESLVTWNCEVVKDYANENRGVYAQIGLGAERVFAREETAIFLEDDNLPDQTFFPYCEEMLDRYAEDERVLWVCGTNYLGKFRHDNGFYLSHHLTPCGWASWATKYSFYYDKNLSITDKDGWKKVVKSHYSDVRLYRQQLRDILAERTRRDEGERYRSWDFHMNLSIRYNNLYSVVPSVNLIENIGVDEFGTHGTPSQGDELTDIMTQRFCGVPTQPLSFPLDAVDSGSFDQEFEREVGNVILYPAKYRVPMQFKSAIKSILGVKPGKSFRCLA